MRTIRRFRILTILKRLCVTLTFAAAFSLCAPNAIAAPAAASDPLHRENPRSTVTAFLETCHSGDYTKASQYLDLSQISPRVRPEQAPALAKDLEDVLNAASGFDALRLSQDPLGNLNDDPDPNIEKVTTIANNGAEFAINLRRSQSTNQVAIWLFAPDLVAKLTQLVPIPTTESQIEARLPRFLVGNRLLDTPLWKWIALCAVAFLMIVVFRLFLGLVRRLGSWFPSKLGPRSRLTWLPAIIDPIFVVFSVTVFHLLEQWIAPSALARLYVGRTLLLVIVGSFALGIINILDYLVVKLDGALDQRQRVVSRSVIYLGRRTLKTLIVIFAVIIVFDNWGFNMTTIIAGLGVGGIAIALAAQQTIANIFGGVSVIADAPVMVGDCGSFGGVIGTVEDIGLRSVRVRTLNRTTVSIPNSAFAGFNLENYANRDKILFNPTFQVKRSNSKDQIRHLLDALQQMLKGRKQIEVGSTPVRISGYMTASFAIEVFAYVLTSDNDEFFKQEAELFLAIDDVVMAAGVELA